LAWKSRFDCRLYCSNFGFVNGDGILGCSDDASDPGDRQNWDSIQRVELAKEISWEEWPFDFFPSVRPPVPALIKRQKPFVSLTAQVCRDNILVVTFDLQRKPRIPRFVWFHGPLPNCAFKDSLRGPGKLPPQQSQNSLSLWLQCCENFIAISLAELRCQIRREVRPRFLSRRSVQYSIAKPPFSVSPGDCSTRRTAPLTSTGRGPISSGTPSSAILSAT
jgi:hypothetical protein